jgi:hypothetical protein
VIIPLIFIFKKLPPAATTADFARLSKMLKWVMLLGILSMMFFLRYTH